MDFYTILDQVIDPPAPASARDVPGICKRQFGFDDTYLEDLKAELIDAQRLAVDEEGKVLVWTGDAGLTAPAPSPSATTQERAPLTYTPSYLAEKILTSRSALEGERKQVTVLFADLKGSMELLADRDPEEARQLLDPVLERMMAAVHRYEGTVNQVMGDGIMALFGAPIAHEDHAVRACYAALAMQDAMQRYSDGGAAHPWRARCRSASGSTAARWWCGPSATTCTWTTPPVGQTTHLAARMEQLATPGAIRLTAATLRLVEGLVAGAGPGACPGQGPDGRRSRSSSSWGRVPSGSVCRPR